jgi:Phage tail tube protein
MANVAQAELAFAFQSAKGVVAASSSERMFVFGGTLPGPVKALRADPNVSTTRIALGPVHETIQAAGSPRFQVRPESIGALLYAVLGAKAVAGASDPWTHTITLGASLPYLTVWRHAAGVLNERLMDCRVASLTLEGRAGAPLTGTVGILGGTAVYRTAQETTAAAETADPLLFRHGAGALRLEGAAVSSISAFTLAIAAGVAIVETLAGPVPMLSGPAVITLQAEQELVDAALWNRLVYGSATPANLAVPTLTALELAGSPAGIEFTFTEQAAPERSLRLALPRVAVAPPDGFEPSPAWAKPRLRATYQAFKPAAGSPITATLKNALSTY